MQNNKMKAIVCLKYGPPEVLQLKEMEKPVPKSNEVLVKIYAVAPTISDCYVRSGKIGFLLWLPMRMYVGFLRPRKPILGFDLAGEIEAIGRDVKRFKTGDQIFAFAGKSFGAYAEYTCLPENGLYSPQDCIISLKPTNMTYEEAAAVSSRGTLALSFIRKGNIQNGQKVLIYGASGGVGTFAIQLAKYFGAEVTGVCSTTNLEMVLSTGADKVIDYTKENFLKKGDRYNFIFDATPYNRATRKKLKLQCRGALAPNGKYLSVDDGTPKSTIDDFIFLKDLIEAGEVKSVIGKTFLLEQLAEVHRYIEQGHKKGNTVITVKQL